MSRKRRKVKRAIRLNTANGPVSKNEMADIWVNELNDASDLVWGLPYRP